MTQTKRITVQFSQDMYDNLQRLAKEQGGISLAEAVRKAIALESYIRQQLKNQKTKLVLESEDSKRELIIR